MANRPANGGAHSAGPQRGPAAAPPPVHHQGFPRSRRTSAPARTASPAAPVLAWLPYLIVLGGVAVGLFVTWQGSQYAALGTALVGSALLAAAAARLVLPPRRAGLLASRGKALDVTAFAVLGAGVLVVAASLP
jgi:hypothetical protein